MVSGGVEAGYGQEELNSGRRWVVWIEGLGEEDRVEVSRCVLVLSF
jgi:hypothetical protein